MKIILTLFFSNLIFFNLINDILASTDVTDKSIHPKKVKIESHFPFAKVDHVEGKTSYLTPGTKDPLDLTKDQIIYSDTSLEVKEYGEISLELFNTKNLQFDRKIKIGASSVVRVFRNKLTEHQVDLLTGHIHVIEKNDKKSDTSSLTIRTQEAHIIPQKSQILIIYNPLLHQTNLFVKEGTSSFFHKDYPSKLKVISQGNYAILPGNTVQIKIQDKLSTKEREKITKEFNLKPQELNSDQKL